MYSRRLRRAVASLRVASRAEQGRCAGFARAAPVRRGAVLPHTVINGRLPAAGTQRPAAPDRSARRQRRTRTHTG